MQFFRRSFGRQQAALLLLLKKDLKMLKDAYGGRSAPEIQRFFDLKTSFGMLKTSYLQNLIFMILSIKFNKRMLKEEGHETAIYP
jgi:hypothetical protein